MSRSRFFYSFLGFHSFLMGLFPFFIPVFLVRSGYSLSEVSLFIALSGCSFCLCLYLWDRVKLRFPLFHTLYLSFFLEIVLVFSLMGQDHIPYLFIPAVLYGIYNCLFWVIQRVLFLSFVRPENSGRKFGNLQIFVLIILKISIFIGGLLMEKWTEYGLLGLSVSTVIAALFYFHGARKSYRLPEDMTNQMPLSIRTIVTFRDQFGSLPTFIIDGVFLFLESYFWLISLFLLVQQSFWQLGVLVIILAVSFSLLFVLIKNNIDKSDIQRIYFCSVILYCLSWIIRGGVSSVNSITFTFVLLIIITFATSFFRLVFNKRFFDIARRTDSYRYIFLKSYLSQFFLAIVFFIISIFHFEPSATAVDLQKIYFIAGLISPVYLLYRMSPKSIE